MATWNIEFNDRIYSFDPNKDITLSTLRHAKGWYGAELASYTKFMNAFGEGDPDALAMVIWTVRKKAGESNVPEPQFMEDFAVGEFLSNFDFVPDPDPDPTKGDIAPSPTEDLTPTSTPYSDDISPE